MKASDIRRCTHSFAVRGIRHSVRAWLPTGDVLIDQGIDIKLLGEPSQRLRGDICIDFVIVGPDEMVPESCGTKVSGPQFSFTAPVSVLEKCTEPVSRHF